MKRKNWNNVDDKLPQKLNNGNLSEVVRVAGINIREDKSTIEVFADAAYDYSKNRWTITESSDKEKGWRVQWWIPI